jgi:hypothetical protein
MLAVAVYHGVGKSIELFKNSPLRTASKAVAGSRPKEGITVVLFKLERRSPNTTRMRYALQSLYKKNSVVLVRKRTIPIERSPPVSEASANFSGERMLRGQRYGSLRPYLRLSRSGAATFPFT